jgi:hypothetical protein
MWIPRTPDEAQKWHAATQREARFHGCLFAGLLWLSIVIILAGGWIAGGRAGVIAQDSVAAGSFWSRFASLLLLSLVYPSPTGCIAVSASANWREHFR